MYQIIIKHIEVKPVVTQHWMKLADSGNANGGGPIYGYAEKSEIENVETEVYRQSVETLNLADVVMTVNGIMAQIVEIATKRQAPEVTK